MSARSGTGYEVVCEGYRTSPVATRERAEAKLRAIDASGCCEGPHHIEGGPHCIEGPACADGDHDDCSGSWVDGDTGALGWCLCGCHEGTR